MTKARLIKRLQWYYPTERFHAYCTFPLLLLYSIYANPIQDIVFLIYGLIVCIFILFQGQLYWKLKLQRLQGKSINQDKYLSFFKKSKKTNVILITLIPVVFVLQLKLQKWDVMTNKMLFWGILANVFAVLEHINYYFVQLMIDNTFDMQYVIRNKRLKRASLAKDLIDNSI